MSSAQERSDAPISTVAGAGVAGFDGDNGPALSAELNHPYGIAVDRNGTVCAADSGNHRIRKVTTDGRITTIAGDGTAGFGGDGGPAASARLNSPREVAVDGAGTLYIADSGNHRIRKITTDGRITTIAGTGTPGFDGDNGPAASALLNHPFGVAVDGAGTLYIADSGNHRVRKVAADGRITTIAGTGAPGFDGDGGPADQARLNRPSGVAVDGAGDAYIADADNHRVRKVSADGTISTVAGTGTAGFDGDGGPADQARLDLPLGLVVDSTGALCIADSGNHRIRKVAADGTISTIAGTGTAGFDGDGGPAGQARLNGPCGLALDCVDALYIADAGNHRIRRIPSALTAALPESGMVVAWANVRSRLWLGVRRESTRDGAEVHQSPTTRREYQRWRLVVADQDNGNVHYTIENVRSGKVLEVPEALAVQGTVIAQRAPAGADAHHQQWRLIPVGSPTDSPRVYEIANRNSGLLLRVEATVPTAVEQHRADGDHRNRQWQLIPV
ncbi:RICIN domain-containing protein [Kitasatospora sp. NPDC092948]|uniref:NHL domain-containing protein n=1 Tax=Kitasatospora sp. NPDC092948 TaxID=3364088 RepID=UPI003814119A